MTDESLALAAARDEAGAFAELLERYQVPLMRFLVRLSARQHDAEDLLQETVFRLYAARRQYRQRWRFKTWAFTIARRVAIDFLRRRVREKTAWEGMKRERAADAVIESDQHDNGDEIWSLARQVLTREQVEALWLFHVESIPPREIAKILDRTWVGVKTMLHRARLRVGSALTEREHLARTSIRGSGGAG